MMDEPRYYVRVRGVISGPFGLGQLQMMRRLERLARFHEVSPDGKSWSSASTVAALFPSSSPGQSQRVRRRCDSEKSECTETPSPSGLAEPSPGQIHWYYANGEQVVGPISLDEFQRLIARGEVHQETLVWAEGMTSWLPYREAATFIPAFAVEPASDPEDFGPPQPWDIRYR